MSAEMIFFPDISSNNHYQNRIHVDIAEAMYNTQWTESSGRTSFSVAMVAM